VVTGEVPAVTVAVSVTTVPAGTVVTGPALEVIAKMVDVAAELCPKTEIGRQLNKPKTTIERMTYTFTAFLTPAL
jgi:hypothetical protein